MQDRNERRRQMRERQKKQAQTQRRNLLFGLSAAAVLIIFSVLMITGMKPGENGAAPLAASDTSEAVTKETTIATTAEITEAKKETTVIHIAAAGDLNITDRVVNAGGEDYDYQLFLRDVAPILSQADYTVLDFEGNVYGEPYGSATGSAPNQLLTALRRAGVDMLQLANSSAIRNGLLGLTATLSAVEDVGLEPIGTFAGSKEFKNSGGYTLVDIEGVKVAFVAFTKGLDGMGLPAGSEDCVNLLYQDYATTYQKVNYDGIRQVLNNAKKESPDVIIALLHWGSEYNDQFSESQQEIEDLMLQNGVSVILGTHAHFVQKMGLNPENNSFIAYCLGDFAGDGSVSGTDCSVILDLEITKNNYNGKVEITGFDFTPICLYDSSEGLRIMQIDHVTKAYEMTYLEMPVKEYYDSILAAKQSLLERIAGEN